MKPISWGDKIWHGDRLHGGPCVWVCVCKWRGDEKACIIVNGLIFSFCGEAFCEEMNCFIRQPHVSFFSFICPYLVVRNMAVHVLSVSLHGFLHSLTFSLSSLICIFGLNCLCCRIEPVNAHGLLSQDAGSGFKVAAVFPLSFLSVLLWLTNPVAAHVSPHWTLCIHLKKRALVNQRKFFNHTNTSKDGSVIKNEDLCQ